MLFYFVVDYLCQYITCKLYNTCTIYHKFDFWISVNCDVIFIPVAFKQNKYSPLYYLQLEIQILIIIMSGVLSFWTYLVFWGFDGLGHIKVTWVTHVTYCCLFLSVVVRCTSFVIRKFLNIFSFICGTTEPISTKWTYNHT